MHPAAHAAMLPPSPSPLLQHLRISVAWVSVQQLQAQTNSRSPSSVHCPPCLELSASFIAAGHRSGSAAVPSPALTAKVVTAEHRATRERETSAFQTSHCNLSFTHGVSRDSERIRHLQRITTTRNRSRPSIHTAGTPMYFQLLSKFKPPSSASIRSTGLPL